MGARASRVRTLVSAIFTEIRAENVTFMAGSIAYHAFVSLLPLLVLLLTVASLLDQASLSNAIFDVARAMLSRGAGDALISELRESTDSAGISLLGLAVLLWGTLRIFRGLDTAFSDIYETEEENSLPDQILDGLVVLAAVALAIVVGGFLQDLGRTGVPRLDWVLGGLGAIVGIGLAFLPMYYVFPDEDVTLREVVPGTAFAAVGLATFETLFGLYLEYGRASEDGGLVAGVIVLLTWLYFSGLVVLVGAVVNAVLANRSRDINVRPVFDGEARTDAASAITAERAELVEAVEALERLLDGDGRVTVAANGDEISIPPPTHVIGDTDAPFLFARGRPVRLELQWTPAPDADGEEGPANNAGDDLVAGETAPTGPAGPPSDETAGADAESAEESDAAVDDGGQPPR